MLFGWTSNDLETMVIEEAQFNHRNGMLSTYVDFVQSAAFPVGYAEEAIVRESPLLIAWEPWDWSTSKGEQPVFAPRRIAAGDLDVWITEWLTTAQTYATQTQIIVRFAPDMNDSSRPWGNSVETVGYAPTTPQEYIDMWRHVYGIKQSVAPDVDFMWNPRNYGGGAHGFETYFPGIQYVDSVGLNGYNWLDPQNPDAVWKSNDNIFGFADGPTSPINKLIGLAEGKPWGLAEAASAPVDPSEFDPGGRYYDSWGSWVYLWPENPPYESQASDWITQEGWTEMLIRRCWDHGASFINLTHTNKGTDWRITDTPQGRSVPDNAVAAGVNLSFGVNFTPTGPGASHGIPRPSPTSDRYPDIHGMGSSFGQGLDENSIRDMLTGLSSSPFHDAFTKFGDVLREIGLILGGAIELGIGALRWVAEGLTSLIDGISQAIRGVFTTTVFAPITEAITDSQADLVDRLDLIPPYCAAVMSHNVQMSWTGSTLLMPFRTANGPSKGAHIDVGKSGIVFDTTGTWTVHAFLNGNGGDGAGSDELQMFLRLYNAAGVLQSERIIRSSPGSDEMGLSMSLPFVVPEVGWYITVWGRSGRPRWWPGGARWSGLSVVRSHQDATGAAPDTVTGQINYG